MPWYRPGSGTCGCKRESEPSPGLACAARGPWSPPSGSSRQPWWVGRRWGDRGGAKRAVRAPGAHVGPAALQAGPLPHRAEPSHVIAGSAQQAHAGVIRWFRAGFSGAGYRRRADNWRPSLCRPPVGARDGRRRAHAVASSIAIDSPVDGSAHLVCTLPSAMTSDELPALQLASGGRAAPTESRSRRRAQTS